MRVHRFAAPTQALETGTSRRTALVRAGIVLLGFAAAPERGLAKKGKRKCMKKKADAVPTCEEHCFPAFPLCYPRTEGPPLCANGAFTDGTAPCSTDQECLGDPDKPYCLVTEVDQVTGTPSRFTTCEPYADGCCISVIT